LYADCNNKLLSEWQTGTILDVFSEYNYLVELSTGARKNIHAIFLRPFAVRVNSVIVDTDEDFG
jgi:hypothetical protein